MVLDEFRHQIKMDDMLMLLDRYPYKIQYKGGFTTFRSKTIVITTNISPENWYPGVRDVTMLRRRLTEFCKLYEFQAIDGHDGDGLPNITKAEMPLADRPARDAQWGSFNRQDNRPPSAAAGGSPDGDMPDWRDRRGDMFD